ncbi:MAG: acyl-CoA reductase [Verrucomicrobiota bacterium]
MPLSTQERASALAQAAAPFPELSRVSQSALVSLLEWELGHPEVLDGFQKYGDLQTRAQPCTPLLHVVSGNTPHAALQTLLRGLLLGAHNLVKLPTGGLPAVSAFLARLPEALQRLVETSETLPETWLARAEAVLVFGNDETIAALHRQLRPEQVFLPHGHRFSLGVIWEGADLAPAAARAARDVRLFDQAGCVSPQAFYVAGQGQALVFAAALAQELEAQRSLLPASPLSSAEASAVFSLRQAFLFRSANDPTVRLFASEDDLDWTVLFDQESAFVASPGNRCVWVKPLPPRPQDFLRALGPTAPGLSTVSAFPLDEAARDYLEPLGAIRLAPLGQAQEPSLLWHQDGRAVLSPLVKWTDFG